MNFGRRFGGHQGSVRICVQPFGIAPLKFISMWLCVFVGLSIRFGLCLGDRKAHHLQKHPLLLPATVGCERDPCKEDQEKVKPVLRLVSAQGVNFGGHHVAWRFPAVRFLSSLGV